MANTYKAFVAAVVMIGLAGIVYYVLTVTNDTVGLLG